MSKQKILSNTSYTNKDFFDAYPELLQKAKELSYKWDPTVSNESDPGVVLIKELALAIDKIDYVADKNVLETMPLSVTQQRNAKMLYNLLGYYPDWYRSAKVKIQLRWNGENKNDSVHIIIPAYTPIQDPDGEYIYTILNQVDLTINGEWTSGEILAIEGTVNNLTVNNSTTITLQMLSNDNRVYIDNYNVAENGIFITDSDGNEWSQVDNVSLQISGERVFMFNVDPITDKCYIEFPQDIADLINDGLNIKYTVTNGFLGNAPTGYLSSFVSSQIDCEKYNKINGIISNNETVSVKTEDLIVRDYAIEEQGRDPLGLNEMYKTWRYIAGTFDTLVTVRDYDNALKRMPDECSNGFACDRTNDIQNSYKVFRGVDNYQYTDVIIEKDSEEKPKLLAYDLKLYCLQAFPYLFETSTLTSVKYANYDKSFQMFVNPDPTDTKSALYEVLELLAGYKCISHDYKALEPDKICYFTNNYQLDISITPTYDLDKESKANLIQNISKAIYQNFNATKVDFGEEIDNDDLYEVIKAADKRIRSVYLVKPEYDTYAHYYTKDEETEKVTWHKVPVSDYAYIKELKAPQSNDWKDVANKFRNEIFAKNILAAVSPLLVDDVKTDKATNEESKPYPYRMNSHYLLDVQDVGYVQTNAWFKTLVAPKEPPAVEDPEWPLQITTSDNDLIQFSRPNLLDYSEYGAYVHYAIKLTNTAGITATAHYQLHTEEYIIFMYKEADGDVKYKYDLFGPGTIIQPSMLISGSTEGVEALKTRLFGTKLPQVGGNYLTTYALSDGKDYDVCSGSDNIIIQKVSCFTLGYDEEQKKERLNYVFFTDGKDNDTSTLTFNATTKRDYTLQTDEYFIYCNSSKTSMEILGAGTKINYLGKGELTLTFDGVSTSELSGGGFSAIEDKMLVITESTKLQVVEQVFTNAMEGDTVKFTLTTSNQNNLYLKLDSQGIVVQNKDSAPNYHYTLYTTNGSVIESTTQDDSRVDKLLEEIIDVNLNKNSDNNMLTINTFNFPVITRSEIGQDEDENPVLISTGTTLQLNGSYHTFNLNGELQTIENMPKYLYTSVCTRNIGGQSTTSELYQNEIVDEYEYGGITYQKTYKQILDQFTSPPTSGIIYNVLTSSGEIDTEAQNKLIEINKSINAQKAAREEKPFSAELQYYSKDPLIVGYLNFNTGASTDDYNMMEGLSPSDAMSIIFSTKRANDSIPLSNFVITITSALDGTESILDTSLTDDAAYTLCSYLNLNVGPLDPQKIEKNQSVEFFDTSGNPIPHGSKQHTGINLEGEGNEAYLYCTSELSVDGSPNKVSVKLISADLVEYYPDFYAYKNATFVTTELGLQIIENISNQKLLLYLDRLPNEYSKNPLNIKNGAILQDIKLPVGKYIFRFNNPNNTLQTLNLGLNNAQLSKQIPLTPINDSANPNLNNPKDYYLCFEITEADQQGRWDLFAKAELKGSAKEESLGAVTIYNLKKYKYNNYNNDYTERNTTQLTYQDMAEVKQKVIDLDVNKNFNYMYDIPSKKKILNPLDSVTFNNENHFYNKFTICEASEPKIKV